ncbi:MAG: anti-sigma factor [Saprospiraceae bacterium]|nr:anti-sigma factor [Saprospiraceae bacterium]
MKEEAKKILESGKLEEYLLGFCSEQDSRKLEELFIKHPELKAHFDQMQEDIEKYAQSLSYPAPQVKGSIKSKIADLESQNTASKILPRKNFSMAASIAAIIALGLAAAFFMQKNSLRNDLSHLTAEYNKLQTDCEENSLQLASYQQQRTFFTHPQTQTVALEGDAMGKEFFANAFWNKELEAGQFNLDFLPRPPDDHCFQLWADVDGEMVNLGVIPQDQRGMVELAFKENATSLNVTIEPTGGSDHPTVSRLVSSARV